MLPAAPPGCVAYPFGAPGGSIDASSNCPPGYIQIDAYNTGSWTSLSPLRQLHDLVTQLEGLGVDVSRAPGGGYNLNFADARAAATTMTICAAQPELCVIVAGGAAVVFTVYVTWPHLVALAQRIEKAISKSIPTIENLLKDCVPVGAPVIVPSTNVRNKGGTSIEQEYLCPDGRRYTVHTIIDKNGRVFEPPHVREGGPKYGLP